MQVCTLVLDLARFAIAGAIAMKAVVVRPKRYRRRTGEEGIVRSDLDTLQTQIP